MKGKHVVYFGLATLPFLAITAGVWSGLGKASRASGQGSTLVETVRAATAEFRTVEAAMAAGYALFHGCVSGPQGGAMGIHYVNGTLVGDGALDATRPEALIYEPRGGRMELVGVEFVVLAEAWNAAHDGPPVLMGQLFHYNAAPNRYGIPAFYELHVWAGKQNPSGPFADWHPGVSCDEYTAVTAGHAGHN